jgi:hypothetical protein
MICCNKNKKLNDCSTDYTDFFYVKNLHEIFSNLACYLNLQPGTHIPSLTNSTCWDIIDTPGGNTTCPILD